MIYHILSFTIHGQKLKSHIRTINLKYQLQLKNKIADKIRRVSKMWLKNISDTNKEKILRKIFIPPELRQKILLVT